MIPKKIHYCWLSGDPFPEKIAYCISTWKKYLPDYEIVLWDLNRFDISKSKWCSQAFQHKKYAFAADYIRAYALYNEGGIYLDSDVEVFKSFNDLLHLGYFIGREYSGLIEPAIVGSEPGMPIMKEMLNYYDNRPFEKSDGSLDMKTMPEIMDEILSSMYKVIDVKSVFEIQDDSKCFYVLPPEFFSPKRTDTFEVLSTNNTYTVHHFNASWFPTKKKLFRWVSKTFGHKIAEFCSRIIKSVGIVK